MPTIAMCSALMSRRRKRWVGFQKSRAMRKRWGMASGTNARGGLQQHRLDLPNPLLHRPGERPAPATDPAAGVPAVTASSSGGRGDVELVELSRTQQLVAWMAESLATVPSFEISMDVDLKAAVDLRARLKALGVAVAADDALVVPTVFDADAKAPGEVARTTRAPAQDRAAAVHRRSGPSARRPVARRRPCPPRGHLG